MDLNIITQGQSYTCAECKNNSKLEENLSVGDVVECEFCGIEYEIASNDDNGNFTLTLLEEEK